MENSMDVAEIVDQPLLYDTYRYGRARQRFRAPRPDLDQPYVACIGASETFGKFVADPFPTLLEQRLDLTVANFGTPGAGVGFFQRDPILLETCSNARVCVIQIMGAWAMSNRLYEVRKRRNERIKEVSSMMRMLYPDVDFDQFRYAHNMLNRLHMLDEQKFKAVEMELRASWISRMRDLLESIETRKVLFWFSERSPDHQMAMHSGRDRMKSPAFVDRDMLEAVSPHADALVEYVATPEAVEGTDDDYRHPPEATAAARAHPTPGMHREASEMLESVVRDLSSLPAV